MKYEVEFYGISQGSFTFGLRTNALKCAELLRLAIEVDEITIWEQETDKCAKIIYEWRR